MASLYRVVGIDPALTATGLVVLESAKPGDYRVTAHETIKPRTNWPMEQRIRFLGERLDAWFSHYASHADAVVIEDPTRQHATRTKRQNPQSIAVMSLAVGAVLSTAQDYHQTVAFIDVEDWMPRVKTGNLEHIMPGGQMVRYLHGQIQIPEGASEHVIFAAGVARFWIERERQNQKLRA